MTSDQSMPSRMAVAARVAIFWLLYGATFFGVGPIMGMAPPAAQLLVAGIVITTVTLVITRVLLRTEALTLASVGAKWSKASVPKFALGFIVGLGMVALLIALTRFVLGPIRFVRQDGVTMNALLMMVPTYIALSAGEETGFRGYPFARLRRTFGTWPAQVVVALAFAVYHMLQGWPPLNALVGTTVGSVLFGAATMMSGGLAFPIGLHAAWNFGSWMLGTKNEAGYWRMELTEPPSLLAGMSVYLAVMMLTLLAMSWRMQRTVADSVRSKVNQLDEAGMGYWVVRATLADGRVFDNVCITDGYRLGFPELTPFKAGEIVNVEGGGTRGSSGAPVLVPSPADARHSNQ